MTSSCIVGSFINGRDGLPVVQCTRLLWWVLENRRRRRHQVGWWEVEGKGWGFPPPWLLNYGQFLGFIQGWTTAYSWHDKCQSCGAEANKRYAFLKSNFFFTFVSTWANAFMSPSLQDKFNQTPRADCFFHHLMKTPFKLWALRGRHRKLSKIKSSSCILPVFLFPKRARNWSQDSIQGQLHPQREWRYPVAEHEWRQCGNRIMWSQSGQCVQSSHGAGRAWGQCLPEEPASPGQRDTQRTMSIGRPCSGHAVYLSAQSSFFRPQYPTRDLF